MDLKVEWFPLPWELLQWHVLFLSQSVNYMAPWLVGKLISFNSGGFPPFLLDTWIEMRDFQNPSHALCFSADEFFRLNLQNWLPVTTLELQLYGWRNGIWCSRSQGSAESPELEGTHRDHPNPAAGPAQGSQGSVGMLPQPPSPPGALCWLNQAVKQHCSRKSPCKKCHFQQQHSVLTFSLRMETASGLTQMLQPTKDCLFCFQWMPKKGSGELLLLLHQMVLSYK